MLPTKYLHPSFDTNDKPKLFLHNETNFSHQAT